MPSFALSRPFITRHLRDPLGLVLLIAVPCLVVGLWHLGALTPERTSVLILAGWVWTGLLPGVMSEPDDPGLDLRWRALPLGAGERWLFAFSVRFPLALLGSELLALLIYFAGPQGLHFPGLFAIAAVSAFAQVTAGTAIAGWSRTSWQQMGLLGLALALGIWAAWSGRPDWAEAIPTDTAREALGALSRGPAVWGPALIKQALVGLVLLMIGVAGYGRR